MATIPIHRPHHCFTLIFSLQIIIPATADKITLDPFTTGKKNTLGITPDRYILNMLASATQTPVMMETVPNTIFCFLSPLSTGWGRLRLIKYKTAEKAAD